MMNNSRAGNTRPAFKLGLLFLMYISQKVFLTFSWTLLPVVLRRQDISMGTIGFIAIVYSPWALKFVHASMIDRYYSTRLGKPKSWIAPLFCLSWVILPLLAILSPIDDLMWILCTVFVLNFLFATIDIAVDGYATDILAPEERPWGNVIQMVGYLFGYMLGAGFWEEYCSGAWAFARYLPWAASALQRSACFRRISPRPRRLACGGYRVHFYP